MARITSVNTITPEYNLSLQEVLGFGKQWLASKPDLLALFERFVRSSKTESRGFILSYEQLLTPPGLAQRAELFEQWAPHYGSKALDGALSKADVNPASISTLVFTSCSCPAIPSVDGAIIEQMELPRTVSRIPIFQHGCAGGVIGLSLANTLASTKGTVALLSVELCSLVFQPGHPSPAELVGAALFADGAAACIIDSSPGTGLTIVDSSSFLIPGSRHLMGYDIFDDGFHLRLDRDLPHALASAAPQTLRSFLAKNDLTPSDIHHWLFHPGGVKILDFLESLLSLRPEQCHWARDVLSSVGNLSSATVLFVLDRFLSSGVCQPGERVVMMGVGPGLTLELILFEMQ